MKRYAQSSAIAATAALTTALVIQSAFASADHRSGKTIKFGAQPRQIEFLDLGAEGTSVGDQHTFSNDLFEEEEQIGRNGGACTITRVESETVHVQCLDTIVIGGDQITVQFSRVDPIGQPPSQPFTGAITGGTGRFEGASGTVWVDPTDLKDHKTVVELTGSGKR